ncbi:ATP-binding cassette domain-containing protein [Faecalibacterium sp. I3-3-33]|uniref:ATP-binding cassette domain-containing protein n=1 Tax=Faecalibacterium sp. I3-3-33 TaxID=2929492 RepID=UPI002014EB14|nr:ATP-binding cassette domain-containing protein [Faecalibacterium sp. I3-3-33]UQK46646.1 ATP-binding cassette domain-containing protein [Faecalibacterium sp. I3-3-33]
MLKLKQINKEYKTGELVQHALNNVSLNLRDNEFVAILGPSGSGKTTLLNIIGGLDRYDSGDLVINGISTKKYTDRDWDSYRNHTIGFVFQSYNLIPHQTVLGNVELALTISGVSKAERRRRAAAALEQVGLGNQLHKHPGEMSGGQMQRVAIARALVNNPDILLADEPTGALDSETSIQVMELLKEVARDRLVVMVTHNPELAERYATRIVKLKDGVIRSDTMPYEPEDEAAAAPVHRNMGHSSMSLLTSLSLSFNNLLTKKARTLLTAFAGSIGIIGIALILSLSNGVSRYISNMEKSTLAAYPLQISSTGVDLTSMMDPDTYTSVSSSAEPAPDGMVTVNQLLAQLNIGATSNDLQSLKEYLDSDACTIRDNATVEYAYAASPLIYRQNPDGTVQKLNPDTTFSDIASESTSVTSIMTSMSSPYVFCEMAETPALYEDQYDIKAGRWPEKYNELVLTLNADGSISDYTLYAMGLRDQAELDKILQQYAKNQKIDLPTDYGTYTYDDFLGMTFKLVNKADCYVYDTEHKVWLSKLNDEAYMQQLVADSEELTIVGIVQPKADATSTILHSGLDYLHDLTYHVIDQAANSEIVRQQLADPDINVLTGEPFDAAGNSMLDIASLFSVDTDALKDAFQFDTSALHFDLDGAFDLTDGSFDLATLIDPSSFKLDLSGLPLPDMEMDMSELFDGVELNISQDGLQALMKKILNGYKRYIISNGLLNLDKIGFSSYMKTEAFQTLLNESMGDLLDTSGLEEQFADTLQQNLQTVMESYSVQLSEALQVQLTAALQEQMGPAIQKLAGQLEQKIAQAIQSNIAQLSTQVESALKIDPAAFQQAIQINMTGSDLTEMIKNTLLSSASSYEKILSDIGYVDYAKPDGIYIYPNSFDTKAQVVSELDAYNAAMRQQGEEDKVIHYTDMVGTLMNSVTEIVGMVSNVLVAFVAISLVVSSIMIGVITYISVLERRKEIGILRAIGASKHNVSQVFNAETFIIGLCSGVMGVVLCLLLLIPGNMLIHHIAGDVNVVASLPPQAALILIVLATLLTMLGGVIPARSAAKSNPVKALRSE